MLYQVVMGLGLAVVMTAGASWGQASRWTRTRNGAVIDQLDLTPKGEGFTLELRETATGPVYSSGFCLGAGQRLICGVRGAGADHSGMVAMEPRGTGLGFRSWTMAGAVSWNGEFQRATGSLNVGSGGEAMDLGSGSRWTRTRNGAVVDVMDLTPSGEGAKAEWREGLGAGVYSSGYCLSAGGGVVCGTQGQKPEWSGVVLMKAQGTGLSFRSWSLAGEVTWTGAFERAGGATAASGGAAQFSGTQYQVENYVYNTPDAFGGKRNLHDFVVDWTGCRVRNLSGEAEQGLVQVKVLTCRPQSRLVFTTTNARTGAVVEYDWVLKDGGRTVMGAWRQGSGFGVSAGGVR